MKRRIILMRHAKSCWKNNKLSDRERPLNKRGQREAPLVGQELNTLGWIPELVVSSDSVRTRETLTGAIDAFTPQPKIVFESDFYLGGVTEVEYVLLALDDAVRSVMLLGHNHGWEEVLTWLSGEYEALKTANAALLELEGQHWSSTLVPPGRWALKSIIRPKDL